MKNLILSFRWIAFLLILHSVSANRLDIAIDLDKRDWIPIFVRMNDQVVSNAGDFEKICNERTRLSRSQNLSLIHISEPTRPY